MINITKERERESSDNQLIARWEGEGGEEHQVQYLQILSCSNSESVSTVKRNNKALNQ